MVKQGEGEYVIGYIVSGETIVSETSEYFVVVPAVGDTVWVHTESDGSAKGVVSLVRHDISNNGHYVSVYLQDVEIYEKGREE